MRSEKEMMELILSVARKDERIRAVYMNGSRTNPNVKKDIFQDLEEVKLRVMRPTWAGHILDPRIATKSRMVIYLELTAMDSLIRLNFCPAY